MIMTNEQKKIIKELKLYLFDISVEERYNHDEWFLNKKTHCANIQSLLELIEKDCVLTDSQNKRILELKKYLEDVKTVDKEEFSQWFPGKKPFSVNVGAWLILIEESE